MNQLKAPTEQTSRKIFQPENNFAANHLVQQAARNIRLKTSLKFPRTLNPENFTNCPSYYESRK
ncbi:CLUMA_CG008520, isoform A [Clunio marinus]|uniref:CLUMA_CG008520, isoform A n=1 Tax=Clunio marinus TaxID=568069 RepID=A0A1J1I419_9DIPT|nr:CLUMA_CG008520, isoform A [Clunio marinus]